MIFSEFLWIGSGVKIVKNANNSLGTFSAPGFGSQTAPAPNQFVNIQKKQPSLLIISKGALQSQNMLPNALTESEQAASANAVESKTSWLFTDWLAGVTEQINESMHYQMSGDAIRLVFRVPQQFFECLQQRIASSAVVTGGSQLNKKVRMPNSVTEFERKDSPPFGVFTKFTWNIYNVLHVKSIFDTQLVRVYFVVICIKTFFGIF